MNKQIRKIIREEVRKIMKEIGEKDPVLNAQSMIKSNTEQVKNLKDELKWKENDSRVTGLPSVEKNARVDAAKTVKDRLEQAEKELELSKQAEINAVLMKQSQNQSQNTNNQTTQSQTTQSQTTQSQTQAQSQIQSQI